MTFQRVTEAKLNATRQLGKKVDDIRENARTVLGALSHIFGTEPYSRLQRVRFTYDSETLTSTIESPFGHGEGSLSINLDGDRVYGRYVFERKGSDSSRAVTWSPVWAFRLYAESEVSPGDEGEYMLDLFASSNQENEQLYHELAKSILATQGA